MNRRRLLRASTAALAGGVATLAGCADPSGSGEPTEGGRTRVMSLSPTVRKTADGWRLEVIVENEHNWDTSFHDVRVLAFAADGTELCEADVGDLVAPGGDSRTVETSCSAFPAIVTATARETPCEDALIPVDRWVGTDAQRTRTVTPGNVVWEDTYRKCGEGVPPKRVLDETDGGGRATSTDDDGG